MPRGANTFLKELISIVKRGKMKIAELLPASVPIDLEIIHDVHFQGSERNLASSLMMFCIVRHIP